MKQKYRYQFPLVWELFKWGITIAIRHPMIKIKRTKVTDPEDSMIIWHSILDDDDN